jgi:hypothetical protein
MSLCLTDDVNIVPEHRSQLLGGVTVLTGALPQQGTITNAAPPQVPVTFIPYGVWNNRTPDGMCIWLRARQRSWSEMMLTDSPQQ